MCKCFSELLQAALETSTTTCQSYGRIWKATAALSPPGALFRAYPFTSCPAHRALLSTPGPHASPGLIRHTCLCTA